MAAHVLAIDAGSSSVRAAIYDATGARVEQTLSRHEIELTAGPGGVVQIEADAMRTVLERAIDGALAAPGVERMEIVAVSMATFWHSLVALDTGGAPLTPVLTWADTRSAPEAAELRSVLDGPAIHQRTGCMLHPSYLPAKLTWLRRHHPRVFESARYFVSFPQYCTGVWLGSFDCSVSMASGSGLLNQERCEWDAELLDALGVEPSRLGAIRADTALLPVLAGAYATRWPQLGDVPWHAPIGDGAASNVGVGCVGPDRLALMVGTSGAMRRCEEGGLDHPIPQGLWRYRLDRQLVLTGGALSDGGSAYEWLRETLLLPAQDVVEAELARRGPAQHGLVVLPFWSGERSLGWVGDATALISGMKLHTTPMDVYQAVLEAVTYRFATLYDALARGGETVVATGGGLRASPAWLQLMADAIGSDVVTTTVSEASLTGAALVGLRNHGLRTTADLRRDPQGPTFRPRPEHYRRHLDARWRQQLLYDREIGPEGANLLARQTR
jgi:gluconokinase